ncbi:hypothetical protein pdam_00025854, partial [Pocillopora damicornis]
MRLRRFYGEKPIYLTQNLNQICFKRLLKGNLSTASSGVSTPGTPSLTRYRFNDPGTPTGK